MTHPSLADIEEKALVRDLLASPRWRSNLINFYGFPDNPVVLQTVPLNDTTGIFGDVDILICSPECPECAVAIEVKRIKVRSGRINRLRDLGDGARQVNQLSRASFLDGAFVCLRCSR